MKYPTNIHNLVLCFEIFIKILYMYLSTTLFFFFFLLFRAAKYGDSQACGPIRATTVGLHHSHAGSEPCLRPALPLTAMPDP